MSKKTKYNNKPWADISQDAKDYFDRHADWFNHFSEEIIEEAQEYYAYSLEAGEYGRLRAAEGAWIYAQGASRYMRK